MEWVYEKHSKDVGCPADPNNQSSNPSSLDNLEENNINVRMKDVVDCVGEDMLVSQPTALVIEGNVEDESLVNSEIDVSAEDSIQKSYQLLNDFSGTLLLDEGGLGKATDVAGLSEKVMEDESEEARDKDKAIKILKEEVGILIRMLYKQSKCFSGSKCVK